MFRHRFSAAALALTSAADQISGSKPGEVLNMVQGKWIGSSGWNTIMDPLNGEPFIRVAEVDETEIQPFVKSLQAKCPKHVLHDPFKSPERYLLFGDVSSKAADMLPKPEVTDFFAKLIQRVSPKSCNDHSFPLEIPVLLLMGSLYMSNKPVLKVDSKNWSATSLISKIKKLAERRNSTDLTIGPVLTFTNEMVLDHMNKLLKIPGAKLLFGGEPLKNHSIPPIYAATEPTIVYVPLEEMMKSDNYELVTKEIFGPFQVITEYKKDQLSIVLDALERMHAHLTAAVVSNDPIFLLKVIGNTVNRTTYARLRARTTGAQQNH